MWEFNKHELFQVRWGLLRALLLRKNLDGHLARAVGRLWATAEKLGLGSGAQDWGGHSTDGYGDLTIWLWPLRS